MQNSITPIVSMGTITGAFGILGWIKIKSDAENHENITKFDNILININSVWKDYKIEKFFLKENFLYIKLQGIDDRDLAMSLRGLTIGISRNNLPKLQDDEYYQFDLIGFSVFNTENLLLGTLKDFMNNGSHSIMVINNDINSLLIPFINNYIINVSLPNKSIIVDWDQSY